MYRARSYWGIAPILVGLFSLQGCGSGSETASADNQLLTSTTNAPPVISGVLGAATLDWMPPTTNMDGSPLADLAGYRIYWGTTPGSYPNSVTVNNPGLASYMVENLVPSTYYFVTTAFNTSGIESEFSNIAQKTIP